MFIKNLLKNKKGKRKVVKFNLFGQMQNVEEDASLLQEGQAKISFNFITANGCLKSGYGFKELSMPQSEDNLNEEYVFPVDGEAVQKLWQLKWYDVAGDRNCYCLFYYNNQNKVCFDDLFAQRLSLPYSWQTEFSSLPFITNYRMNQQDQILLSGKDERVMIISGSGQKQEGSAPAIISCCNHYGKLFAITAKARGSLVYTDTDIINWKNENAKNLDFSDGRGDLNKIISFNDYIYLFRDFGITKLSVYSGEDEFAISHIYKSSAYIYPETIVENGDAVYFLEGDKLKCFDGNNVKQFKVSPLYFLQGQDNRFATAAIYQGKYFLACRGSFEGESIGCERGEFKNNLLIVYDISQNTVDLLRGVDIRGLLTLENHLKQKLIACFYNQNQSKIGQLTTDGRIFDEKMPAMWKSGKMDFDAPEEFKMIRNIMLTSFGDAEIVVRSEREEKKYNITGKVDVQNIPVKVSGKNFEIEIHCSGQESDYISDFALVVG